MPAFNIGFVMFTDLTQLDFTGPLQVLARLPLSASSPNSPARRAGLDKARSL